MKKSLFVWVAVIAILASQASAMACGVEGGSKADGSKVEGEAEV